MSEVNVRIGILAGCRAENLKAVQARLSQAIDLGSDSYAPLELMKANLASNVPPLDGLQASRGVADSRHDKRIRHHHGLYRSEAVRELHTERIDENSRRLYHLDDFRRGLLASRCQPQGTETHDELANARH